MKRRYRKLLNLFSIGLLLFALYLNFIKKETTEVSVLGNYEIAVTPGTSNKSEPKALSAKQPNNTLVLK
jgi:hypothetical protein